MFLCSEFRLLMSVRFPHEKDVRLVFYLQLFVGGFMSYLLYLCLFAESGGQHIFFFVLCTLYCKFLWIVHFLLPVRYYLTLIYTFVHGHECYFSIHYKESIYLINSHSCNIK